MKAGVVFLDISKVINGTWQEVLLFKLHQNGISGDNFIKEFFSCRKQRIMLNGQHWLWAHAKAGVPQGSILDPLRFLIYINDLRNILSSNAKLFGDGASLIQL